MNSNPPQLPNIDFPPRPDGSEDPRARALRRLRAWRPTPEERSIIEHARSRAQGYSTAFVVGWGGASLAFARYRRLGLFPTFIITSTGAFLGSQAGRIFSVYQGVKELRQMPQSELGHIINDLQSELKGEVIPPREILDRLPPAGPAATPPPTPLPTATPDTPAAPTSSAWDSLRRSSDGPSAWDTLRKTGPPPADGPVRSRSDLSKAASSAEPTEEDGATWDRFRSAAPASGAANESAWVHLRSHPAAPASRPGSIAVEVETGRGAATRQVVNVAGPAVGGVRTNAYGDPIE
ncbi:hypothetical protein H9P43_008541 [Blastocladiella emersonii ATCC 22665]|nr:hypothetical protein H9P43_008541 [Blastocladiella emersonii ATCC 22665]